ncbi:MAG: hypothetical protein ACWGKN_12540 [Desulfoprunum sp.]
MNPDGLPGDFLQRILCEGAMCNDDKYCYSLAELAEKWRKTENDILQLAAKKKLWLSVNLTDFQPDNINGIKINLCLSPYEKPYFDGKEIKAWLPPVPIEGWWQLLIPSEITGFLPDREESYFIMMHTNGWMGGGMAGWFGGGMWIWTLIGVVVIVLLVVLINRISRK